MSTEVWSGNVGVGEVVRTGMYLRERLTGLAEGLAVALHVLGFSKLSSVNGGSYLGPPVSLETLFFSSKLKATHIKLDFLK